MKDDHIFICVTEKFKTKVKEVYGFDLSVTPITDDARIYVCGKNTPSENYGVKIDSTLYEVVRSQPGTTDFCWTANVFPADLFMILKYFDAPENETIDSNVADPNIKGEGFHTKFRFLVKRDRHWAHDRNKYYLTFMIPNEVDMAKSDTRYKDPAAEALLKQWD